MRVSLLFLSKLIFNIIVDCKTLKLAVPSPPSDKIDIIYILNSSLFCALTFETLQGRDSLTMSCGDLNFDFWRLLAVKQAARTI